ncbi:MAG: hypothetical protein WC784_01355 [Candidatus Shapirobacteria bacterium]|jgi:hypothetical protein
MRKYSVIIILVVVAIWMGITKIRYRNVDWSQLNTTIISTVSPTSAPQNDVNYPLWKLLPYTGKDFVVDRYTQPLTLAIKIKSVDKKIVTEEVYQWMLDNKVATESHKLVFEEK